MFIFSWRFMLDWYMCSIVGRVSVACQTYFYKSFLPFSKLIRTVAQICAKLKWRHPANTFSFRIFSVRGVWCGDVCSVPFATQFVCGSVNRFFYLARWRVIPFKWLTHKTQHVTDSFVSVIVTVVIVTTSGEGEKKSFAKMFVVVYMDLFIYCVTTWNVIK